MSKCFTDFGSVLNLHWAGISKRVWVRQLKLNLRTQWSNHWVIDFDKKPDQTPPQIHYGLSLSLCPVVSLSELTSDSSTLLHAHTHMHSPSSSHALSSPILNLLWHDECSILVVSELPTRKQIAATAFVYNCHSAEDSKVFLRENKATRHQMCFWFHARCVSISLF